MKRLLLIGILLWGVQAFASSCSSTGGGGNWDQTGSWTSCGGVVPQVGDTVTITAGNPITVPAGYSTNNVNSVTFSGTNASLTVAATGTLNTKALTFAGTTPSVTNNGTIVVNPAASSTAVTITTGGVLTNNGTITAGYPSAVAGTIAIISNANGTLTSNVGSVLNLYGDLQYQKGGFVNLYGTAVTFKPPSGVRFYLEQAVTGSGVGAVNVCATSACDGTATNPNGSPYTPTTFTTDLSSGGNAFQWISANTNSYATITMRGAEFTNCGTASLGCVTLTGTASTGAMYLRDAKFVSTGQVWNGATTNIDIVYQRLTLITPLQAPWIGITGTAAKGSETRYVGSVVAYSPAASPSSTNVIGLEILAPGVQVGKSLLRDGVYEAGFISYNGEIAASVGSGAHNQTYRQSAVVIDSSGSGTGLSCWITAPRAANAFQDSGCLQKGANNHFWSESGSDLAVSSTIAQANWLDGDGAAQTDYGDNCFFNDDAKCKNNIFLNNSGTDITQSGSSTTTTTMAYQNNTSIASQAMTLGEANFVQTAIGPTTGNIFYFPQQGTSTSLKTGGITPAGKFYSLNSSFVLDSNYFWGTTGTGDSNAYYTAVPGSLSGSAPMLEMPSGGYTYITSPIAGQWVSASSTAGTDNTTGTIVCTSCSFFADQVGNFYIQDTTKSSYLPITGYTSSTTVTTTNLNFTNGGGDTLKTYPQGFVPSTSCTVSGSSNPYTLTCAGMDFPNQGVQAGCFVVNSVSFPNGNLGTVVSVTGATTLTFNQSSRPVTTGSVIIQPALRKDGTLYGATNFGAKDLHIDPSFVDPTVSVCKWLATNLGRDTRYCQRSNLYQIAVTTYNSGTKTVTVAGGGANSVPAYWQAGDPVMALTSGGAGFGTYDSIATIAGDYSSFTLTSGITSLSSSNVLVNLWSTVNFGRVMVTLNGFDYTGAPCASGAGCYSWATMDNLWKYIQQRARPMNGAFKNAAPAAYCDHTTVDNSCDVGALDSFPAAILQQ